VVKVKLWEKFKNRQKLITAFREGGIYKTIGSEERKIYPKIHDIRPNNKSTKYVFTLPTGINPDLLKKNFFVFEQIFGKSINLDGEIKTFVLSVRKPKEEGEKDELIYSVEEIKKAVKGAKLGVICGVNSSGEYKTYDLTKEPHLLIAGETGSGKSTQLRSILTTLILNKKPCELELYLADCKKSEFHIFRRVEHVRCVLSKPKEIERMLMGIKREMDERSDLTEMYEVGHIDDLPKGHKKPYIIVCIDEFVLLRKNEEIMETLIDIVCVGRTLGVFAMLSMQRPNAKTLDTTIRAQCTVAMGFQLRDKTESRIVNTPNAEKITDPGYFIMNADKLYDLQAPYLELDDAKDLLNPFYVMKQPAKEVSPEEPKQLKESDVFNDADEQG
jgi:S-DNA-T family DNA segregation ATPase FtsK/SpoIIIE